MHKKKKFIWIIAGVIIVLLIIVSFLMNKKPKIEYTTSKAARADLIQTVSETGSVKPLNELELNFLGSGQVVELNAKVGDQVKKDQVLAVIDYSDLSIKSLEAEAQLAMYNSQLEKLLAGASPEDLEIAQATFDQAKTNYEASVREMNNIQTSVDVSLSQAEKTLSDLSDNPNIVPLQQAVAQAQTALENTKKTFERSVANQSDSLTVSMRSKLSVLNTALDSIDRLINDDDLSLYLGARDSSYANKTKNYWQSSKTSLTEAEKVVSAINDSTDAKEVANAYSKTSSAASDTFRAINTCYNMLEKSITGAGFSITQLDAFKTNISTQISSVGSAVQTLQAGKQSLDDALLSYDTNVANAQHAYDQAKSSLEDGKVRANNTLSTTKTSRDQQLTSAADRVEAAKKALRIADAQLNKVKAAARVEDVNLIRAQIRQAQASVALVKNQIDHNKIEAPLDGIITEVNYKLGEQTSISKTAIKMMAQDGYEIELDISETDIAKLKIGDTAKITFDAFGDNVKLDGRVASIDPAQTIIQGVIYYQTKIDFMSDQTEIKPGMTATADIETAKKDNALVIPYRAVQEKDGRKIVKVLKNNQPEEKQVEIGLIGDGGQAEVISGISEGDDVITFTKNNEKTNTSGQN